MLERILGRDKNETEFKGRNPQQAQQQRKLTPEEQAITDTFERPGAPDEKLEALVKNANARAEEFTKQGFITEKSQINQAGQGPIEAIAQGRMPEGVNGPDMSVGVRPLEGDAAAGRPGVINEQPGVSTEKQTGLSGNEQKSAPIGLEKMMLDFREGLVKSGYSRENADKLASLYTDDLFSKLAQNDQLGEYIERYEELPPKSKMEAYLPAFKKAFISLGISSIIPIIGGNFMYMIPGALFAGVSLVSNMSQAEKMTFAEGIKKNKEKFVKQGVATNVQIENILGQINQILERDKAIPPELMGQAVQEIERQNLLLAEYLDKNIDSDTKKKLDQVYQKSSTFKSVPTGGIFTKDGRQGAQGQIQQPIPGGAAGKNAKQLQRAA